MAENIYTSEQDEQFITKIDTDFSFQKDSFSKQPYPSAEQRINDLKRLKQAILLHQDELITALSEDFGGRSEDDSRMGDLMPTLMGIDYTIKHIRRWMKPSKRHVGVLFQPAKAYVMYQPLGVVGIITPWNYPLFLSLGPLTTVLAAGNRAMIKMSEFTPNINKAIEKLLTTTFTNEQVSIVAGGASVAVHFSNQPFDHLLFTGSTNVGKLVMAAAAKNLTPVTLELGGKSPTVIDDKIDMKDAVSRFILGKTLNAGQTCVAPDYVLCPSNRKQELVEACQYWFNKMYPSIAQNDDYTSIINRAQLNRILTWLDDAKTKGANVVNLSKESIDTCVAQGKLPLVIISDVTDDMTLMKEEIFGPLLPIVTYDNIDEAIDYVNDRDRPLALYLCSHDEALQQRVLATTHAGGVCINDAAMHVVQDDLPFGGVGPSGMGLYHGHEGFLTFSKAKSVFKKGKLHSAVMAFPPYGKLIHKFIYKFFLR